MPQTKPSPTADQPLSATCAGAFRAGAIGRLAALIARRLGGLLARRAYPPDTPHLRRDIGLAPERPARRHPDFPLI